MVDEFDEFDDNMFEEEDELFDEMIGEEGFEDDEFDEFDDDEFDDDEFDDDDESSIDFLGMVQDDEGNWVYPEDLD